MKRLFIILLNISIFTSCSTQLGNELKGNWIINDIKYNDTQIKSSSFRSVNVLVFYKEGKCQFPSFTEAYGVGMWELETQNKKSRIYITSDDPIFTGEFDIIFSSQTNDNGERLELILSNETTLIKCTKAF